MKRLVLLVAGLTLLAASTADAAGCTIDPISGRVVCHESGRTPPVPGPPGERPPGEPDPIRYVYTTIDPMVGECYYWSRIPGGLDSWDPANDAAIIFIVTRLPECPGPPPPAPGVDGRAWDVFRSFPLTPPDVSLEPPGTGITGLATYLAAPEPQAIVHTEVLPDGRVLEVRAQVVALAVDWGDGTAASADPSAAQPYPAGSVTHVYRLKTCPPDYRATHPAGILCHPTLEAYPITAVFTWAGAYRAGGPWVPIGSLDLLTVTPYDVDEVIGVLIP